MGRIEDDEPATKRVKVSSEEDSRGLSLSLSTTSLNNCSSSMARPLAAPQRDDDDDEVVGSSGIVKKVELVRIIAEALYSLGYENAGARLEEESGIPLHSAVVNVFMQQILDGKWDESVATLRRIGSVDDKIMKSASFVILERKFFELLDGNRYMDALKTLRTEIAPLGINIDRVSELASFVISSREKGSNGISGMESRRRLLEQLQNLLPPNVIIPEKRLVHLVEQALDLQRETCRFHNSSVGEMSLLVDHQCGKDQIPSQTLQILKDHNHDVWFLQFSHNGKYLASSSGDCLVIIWEVGMDGEVSLKHRLSGHQKPVSYISWSPDDHQLLTCGLEESIRRWDSSSGECLHVYEKVGLALISCEWAPDGKKVFSGLTDKSISMWDLDGKEVESWKGNKIIRTSDMGVSSHGNQLVTLCKETTMLLFEWESKSEKFVQEDCHIVSFALSRDGKYLLLSLKNKELHLWKIDGNVKLVAKYKGHHQDRLVVRPCFGGLGESFIASGSEDSKVYIWHRASGELVLTLPGHSAAVNCVSWNPSNPHMLASASDDRTIRIWGLKGSKVNVNQNGKPHSNGYCNGGS